MDPAQKFSWESLAPLDAPVGEPGSEARLSKVLRLVGPLDDIGGGLPPTRRSSPQDWSLLIDRVRHAATHAREVEAQAQEQEQRLRDLLERAREDLKLAAERVRTAEARTADIQSRADVLLNDADERVKSAEERARIAEEWLSRVYDTIANEFSVEATAKRTA